MIVLIDVFLMRQNEDEVKLTINLVSNYHGLTKIHVVWAYPPSLHYNLWFCVCCMCVTDHIWYHRKGAHVHLEGWKHGNGDTGLNKVCTQ